MKLEINGYLKNVFQTLNYIETWDDFYNPPENKCLIDEKFKLNELNIDAHKYNNIPYLKLLCSYNCEKIIESRYALLFFLYVDYFFV